MYTHIYRYLFVKYVMDDHICDISKSAHVCPRWQVSTSIHMQIACACRKAPLCNHCRDSTRKTKPGNTNCNEATVKPADLIKRVPVDEPGLQQVQTIALAQIADVLHPSDMLEGVPLRGQGFFNMSAPLCLCLSVAVCLSAWLSVREAGWLSVHVDLSLSLSLSLCPAGIFSGAQGLRATEA